MYIIPELDKIYYFCALLFYLNIIGIPYYVVPRINCMDKCMGCVARDLCLRQKRLCPTCLSWIASSSTWIQNNHRPPLTYPCTFEARTCLISNHNYPRTWETAKQPRPTSMGCCPSSMIRILTCGTCPSTIFWESSAVRIRHSSHKISVLRLNWRMDY